MNDQPRQTLRRLIAKYGHNLCSDAGRCEGLLRDLCGAHRREINILIAALKERIPLDLLAVQTTAPRELLLTRLAKRLEDQSAVTEAAARWAVDSWALALGVLTEAEVAQREKQATLAPPPAATTDTQPRPQPETRKSPPTTQQPPQPKPPASQSKPPTPQPPFRQTPPPPPPRTQTPPPPARRATSAPAPLNAMPARPPSGAVPSVARPQTPAPPAAMQPASPDPQTLSPQHPAFDPATRKRGKWRGCLIGCFLVVLLSLLLVFAAPYIISILQEEQRQQNSEPPRIPGQ